MRSPDHSRLSLLETERLTKESEPLCFLFAHNLHVAFGISKKSPHQQNHVFIFSKFCINTVIY